MRSIVCSLVLATALIGCASDTTEPPGERQLVATLAALPGGGNMTGSTDVRWTIGAEQFTATATITNDLPSAIRPWHVHFGSCPNSGDVVGPAGSYEPMVVGTDGTARMTATVAFELDATVPYSVNVHESQAALSTIIACGNLVVAGGGGGGGGGGGDDGGY